ncbi:hydantoinase/oxoprolinase family protein [Afifella sp. IM 167]|uniref:hydantoinase/oxoprolinase family protein n=1 Tax=Afifella sp. IM 167 TaxID=2033586 RepID=UPI001CCB6984|nr:hydantoinase/oxoprolinase family protein [Afifella sp. IM 167]MBZ8134816.1 5-oxoprolinase [Afifella sp. IM 167]
MRIGIDVGGTFTDVVATTSERGLVFVKTSSTPDDPSRGVIEGLHLLAAELGLSFEALLQDLEMLVHGTTVATNILVERNGARVGLLTTAGFGDLLVMREGTKARRYSLRDPFPEPLVAKELRKEVRERLRADGSVETALDLEDLDRAIAELKDAGVDAVAICFLHAHRNSGHERLALERIEQSGWPVYVSMASELLAKEGEYDRLSTAVVNAYVGPGFSRYLRRLSDRLAADGATAPILVMQSNGGVLPIAEAGRRAVGAVTSGPAGGARAAALFARSMNLENVVSYDTGGTSSDVCVVEGHVPIESPSKTMSDLKIAVSAIEINPVGLGGGSIACLDPAGILTIGPQSAGATPGPAAFGRGGNRATLTDANVVLGCIAPGSFLGGRLKIAPALAHAAIEREIAAPLQIGVEEAAFAIQQLAVSKISEGIRLATVRRGADPRDFALMCFGGAGGLHADAVARELEIPKAIVPRQASVLSALGFLATEVRHDFSRSLGRPLDRISPGGLREIFGELVNEGREALLRDGFSGERQVMRLTVECRYRRQVDSIDVPLTQEELEGDGPALLQERFTDLYRGLFHHSHDEPGFIDSCRLAALGRIPALTLPVVETSSAVPYGSRRLYLDEWIDCPAYWFDDLGSGAVFEGPGLVDSDSTTVLVLPGSRATVEPNGSLVITRGGV